MPQGTSLLLLPEGPTGSLQRCGPPLRPCHSNTTAPASRAKQPVVVRGQDFPDGQRGHSSGVEAAQERCLNPKEPGEAPLA